jgi:subtilisin family serine protease
MSNGAQSYTYRSGERIDLIKGEDEIVVRALPDVLESNQIMHSVQVSSASSKVPTSAGERDTLMQTASEIAPTFFDYRVADTEDEFLITDRVFVTFAANATKADIDRIAGKYGLLVREAYAEREFLFQMSRMTNLDPVDLVVKLTEDENLVESVDHDLNYRVVVQALNLPTDNQYERQWHLHGRFVATTNLLDPRASAKCEEAWKLLDSFGSSDVVIGITDDGCKLDHPDFNSPDKFADWGYFKRGELVTKGDIDADPSEMYQERQNHGTACAGVAAAEVDGELTVGAAPGCRLLPIKFESAGSSITIGDSKLLATLEYVADKVDILSSSWISSGIRDFYIKDVRDKIRELSKTGGRRGKGIVFLWAAGNFNRPLNLRIDGQRIVPINNGWNAIQTIWTGIRKSDHFRNELSQIPAVMHVGALASTAQRSHYSNYGEGVDICAPTSNRHYYLRIPTIQGLGVTTTTGANRFRDVIEPGVRSSFGGTSSATPLVAGIAALVISANPDLTADEVCSILKSTASKDLNFDPYPRTPPGDPNDPAVSRDDSRIDKTSWVDTSWDISPVAPFDKGEFKNNGSPDGTWSPWFGHGKVDALEAVKEALRRRL